jgi:uncharacterized damage-inducible protein DinB
MKKHLWLVLMALPMAAQNPYSEDAKATYAMLSANVVKAAERMPEEKYNFKPVDGVNTFGGLVMHLAQAQGGICGAAAGKKMTPPAKKPETKTELVAALKAAVEFCSEAYAGMNDAAGAEKVQLFGMTKPKVGWLYFNNAHTYEHYGNLSTYLRMNGLVPPSSDKR